MASAAFDDWAPSSALSQAAIQPPATTKKPRHRHSPEQLVALNELYEKSEHPSLELRTALAERLGMETKTVNAWFQNKRASSKKRSRTVINGQPNGSHLNSPHASSSSNPPPATTPGDQPELDEDDYPTSFRAVAEDLSASKGSQESSAVDLSSINSSFYAGNPDHNHFISRDSPDLANMPKKMRLRPSPEQTEELKKIYSVNPHPTSEERQVLSERLGMRYQSITNWFQNQRSLAKRRKDDEQTETMLISKTDYPHNGDMRQYSAFPPPPPHHMHPSLTASANSVSSHNGPHVSSSSTQLSRLGRSSSPSSVDDLASRRSLRRSTTPYSGAPSRPRRLRPEPYQLDALKGLFTRTSTPTIEERSALALEIGMDVGKVTNWFRNLRQTARKRSNRHLDQGASGAGSGDEDDDQDELAYSSMSRSQSRDGTPPLSTRSYSSSSSMMELDHERDQGASNRNDMPPSNVPSEDEGYSEVITPEEGHSPSPGPDLVQKSYPQYLRDTLPPQIPPRDAYSPSYPHRPPFYSPHPYPPSHYAHSRHRQLPPVLHKHDSGAIALGHFNAAVAIFEPPLSKFHPYLNDDPASCAETAKRYGINLEDAYLLLDFHRQ